MLAASRRPIAPVPVVRTPVPLDLHMPPDTRLGVLSQPGPFSAAERPRSRFQTPVLADHPMPGFIAVPALCPAAELQEHQPVHLREGLAGRYRAIVGRPATDSRIQPLNQASLRGSLMPVHDF